MKKTDWFKLIVAVVIANLAGAVGAVFTMPAIPTWYATLAQPALNPPSWIFAPVWTALYILMGVAAGLVWCRGWGRKDVKIALSVFSVQLILNVLWSIIFFGQHDPGAALAEIVLLWLAILACIIFFWKISRPAAYLLIPYILWVSFAAVLNFGIWRLNPGSS